MSVTMSRTGGATVFTLTSDPSSRLPPLCQILSSLCYSPACCSVSQQLRKVQGTSLSVLGAVHVLIGLLNVGLGTVLYLTYLTSFFYYNSCFPFWMGALFVAFGVMCLLSERYPSPCLVVLNVIFNLAGAAMAMAAIVLYSMYVRWIYYVWSPCDRSYGYGAFYRVLTPSPGSDDAYMRAACLQGVALAMTVMWGITGVLIVLSVVELCAAISAAVLGIRALRRSSQQKKVSDDPEEVTTQSSA